jgi:hypothetical protein
MTKPKRYKRFNSEFKREAIRRGSEEGGRPHCYSLCALIEFAAVSHALSLLAIWPAVTH